VIGRLVGASLIALALAATAWAQQPSGAMGGLQLQRGQPLRIESETLEVRDKQRLATFSGNVKVTQGDSTVQCKTLVVFYEDGATTPAKKDTKQDNPEVAQKGGAVGGQQIKRLEAKGDVVIVQKDQTARGDTAHFDMKTNFVTLTGNVTVTQGQNVLRGERMTVDLTTGLARVESGKGRVTLDLQNTKQGPAR